MLTKTGNLTVETISFSLKGKSDTKIPGQWMASGDALLFSYLANSKQMVLKYSASLSGNTLTLVQGTIKTVYHRK